MRLVGAQHGVDLPARDLAEAEFLRTYRLPDEADGRGRPTPDRVPTRHHHEGNTT